jgi:hypothetical protein
VILTLYKAGLKSCICGGEKYMEVFFCDKLANIGKHARKG